MYFTIFFDVSNLQIKQEHRKKAVDLTRNKKTKERKKDKMSSKC